LIPAYTHIGKSLVFMSFTCGSLLLGSHTLSELVPFQIQIPEIWSINQDLK